MRKWVASMETGVDRLLNYSYHSNNTRKTLKDIANNEALCQQIRRKNLFALIVK